MHILATLFVLASLGVALGVIGGMLFAYREQIAIALAGGSRAPDLGVSFEKYGNYQAFRRRAPQPLIKALPPLPLAA
jgi:hypothetical protein